MSVSASPSSNLIWGGYHPRRVLSGSRSALAEVSGVDAGGLVASPRRAALDRVKGKALQRRRIETQETAVFRQFRDLGCNTVTISTVTIEAGTAVFRGFGMARRLIADYATGRIGGRERDPAGAARGAEAGGGPPPFRLADRTTPVAHSAAGVGEKAGSTLPPMSASTGRGKSAVRHGVGGRGAPALARTWRNQTEKTGPGAESRAERTLSQRADGAAGVGAGDATVQGGNGPFGLKGEATLCAPGLHVN